GPPAARLTGSTRSRSESRSRAQTFRRRAASYSSLHLPATAERFVELHDRRELVSCGPREIDLGSEELPLRIEDVQVRADAVFVAKVRDVERALSGLHTRLLLSADVAGLGPEDQRVFDLAERLLDRLLVLNQRLLLSCLGCAEVAAE